MRSLGPVVTSTFVRARGVMRRIWTWMRTSMWPSIPSYLPFYILATVVIYAGFLGSRQVTVISVFQLPPKSESLPFSGETVANVLRDAITAVREEAETGTKHPPCDAGVNDHTEASALYAINKTWFPGLNVQPSTRFERPSAVAVEVKGISVESLVSLAREVLGREKLISGDVVFDGPNSFQLIARAKDEGPWTVEPQTVSLVGLKSASCRMAEEILKSIDRNTAAAALIQRQKFTDVIALYAPVHGLDDDADALNNLGIAKAMLHRVDDGIAMFRQALNVRRTFPKAEYNLGWALDHRGQCAEAIVEYDKALEMQPDFVEARNGLGVALSSKGRWDDAIAEYQKAIKLEPDNSGPHYLLGTALSIMGHREEGKAELLSAIRLAPNSSDVYLGVGTALQFSGHKDEAIINFKKAIELKPNSVQAHIALGELLAETHQPGESAPESISECRVAIGLQPDSSEAHECLGDALLIGADLFFGDTRDAVAEYKKAIELNPYNASAHNALGFMLMLPSKVNFQYKEKLDEAIVEFKKAIEFNCDYPNAREGLDEAVALKECKDFKTCSLVAWHKN